MKTNSVNAETRNMINQIQKIATESSKAWELANDSTRSTRSRSAQQRKFDRLQLLAGDMAIDMGWKLDWPGLFPGYTDPNGYEHTTPQSAIAHGGNERKIESIQVVGGRWFDSMNGNTYHNVKVSINGEAWLYGDFQYGYESAYLQTARDVLLTVGLSLSDIRQDDSIEYMDTVAGNYKKADLVNNRF